MVSRRRRFVRFIGWCIAAFASVAAVLLLIFATYLIFFDHSETLRQKLEAELSAVAGSSVSIGSINLNWARYAFELRDISVAGPDEDPLLTVDRVWGQLRLSEILRFRLHWTELLVQRLTLRLPEVSGEGVSLARTTGGDSGVSISAERVALEDASILIADETLPWRFEASNLGISIERTSSGSYAGRLNYEDGGLVIKDHPEMRGSVSAAFEIAAGELLLHEARALSELGELRAKGKLGLGGGVRGRFEVSAEGPVERSMASIFGVSSNPQAITGMMALNGTLDLSPENQLLEGSVRWARGRLLGVAASDWSGEIFWDRQLLQLSGAEGIIASGRGRVELHQALPLVDHPASLEIAIDGATLAEVVAGMRGRPSPVDSLVSGRISLNLPAAEPRRADGTFELKGLKDLKETSPSVEEAMAFELSGRVQDGDIEIESARVDSDAVSGTFSGLYPRVGSAELFVDIRSDDLARTDELARDVRRLLRPDDEADPEPWGISGTGFARGRLSERIPHFTFDGDVAAEVLQFDRLLIRDVRSRGVLSREVLRFEDLVANKSGGVVAGAGELTLEGPFDARDFDVSLRFSDWPASDLTTLLDWSASAEGLASGNLDVARIGGELAGTASLTIIEPVFFGETFDRATASAVFDGTTIKLEDAELVQRQSSFGGHLTMDLETGVIEGTLSTDSFALTGHTVLERDLDGRLEIEATIAGRMDVPVVDLRGHARELLLDGMSLGQASIAGRLGGTELTLSIELDERHALEVTSRLEGDFPTSGTVRFQDLDVGPWLDRMSEWLPQPVRIRASGQSSFAVDLKRPEIASLDATLANVTVESESFRLDSLAPIEVYLADGVLRVPTLSLAEDTSRVAVGGTVNFRAKTLDLRAEGATTLGLLESFYPGMAATGDVDLSARITGSWDRPSLSGHADLAGSSLRVEGFRQTIGDLRGRLVFDNRTIRIPELTGVFGSGPITIAGAISLEDLRPGSLDLRARGTGMRLRYPEGLVATLDAELTLIGSRGEQVLSGHVTLRDAVWSREYDLVSGILSDSEELALFEELEGAALLENLRFDITIEAPESLRLRNSIAEIDASAELELRGTLAEPVLLGSMEAQRGEVFLLGQRYDITSGKVDFVDPTKVVPFIELTAETRVRSYRVQLRLTGTPDRFYPDLSSDPPLRTVDILRLLSGASERDILIGTEEEELAGVGVASLLTERLTAEVGRRAERLFGLDRFSINPFLVGRFANPTARINLGKQITRDLSINYSTNLNSTQEAIIVIEYTPEGSMSWILSRDEDGDIGIDVKFRKSF